MINRVLIRIKVVQLLYSYLLVENQFNLESPSEQPTRESRFAYSLYLDMLGIMACVASGVKRRGGDMPLRNTRFMLALTTDEKIKTLLQKWRMNGNPYENVISMLVENVKESQIYKNFIKAEGTDKVDDKIWQDIFNVILLPDTRLREIISSQENYTLRGEERMEMMMEKTFRNFYVSSDNLPDALKTLAMSMDRARELYFRLLDLPVRLSMLREADIDDARNKFLASAEDRNPNMRFVNNAFVDAIAHSETVQKAIEGYGINISADDEPMLRSLLRAVMESDIYKEYMEFPATDFKTDCEFWKNVYRQVIFDNPDLLEALEDKSVFWNDDLDIIGTFVSKTVKRIGDGKGEDAFLPMYKDEEDARFGAELFSAVVKNKTLYRKYIDDALDTSIWESDRLAFMDVVVLMAAIAEMLNFPKIPLNVTINEYIEISKAYSTAKSGVFVNGLLGVIVRQLGLS